MSIGKDEVLEVLSDFRIRGIRFSAGPIQVNVDEYDRVADFIEFEAITVKAAAKKDGKRYLPQINTLYLIDGNSVTDFNIRSGILHECTHIIADINKAAVTRLHDEAAAYLAQFSFHMLLDPSFEAPMIRGIPLNDLIRVGLSLVAQYGLGQPKGYGAVISESDIMTLGHLVQRTPEYSSLKDEDQLAADGVDLTDDQAEAHRVKELARSADKAKYEEWLLRTVKAAQGSGTQKQSAFGQLRNHFFMVYQPVATMLLARFLSAATKGDPLSDLFNRGFSAQEKQLLLDDLRVPKPPG